MFDKDSLHHAYFIEGDRAAVLADIDAFLEGSLAIARAGHPDVHYSEYESFGIDEGRALQSMQSFRPVMGDKKVFIVAADAITSEAQNALLKVFEEPTPGTHFFIIASTKRVLLPTLASRVFLVTHPSSREVSQAEEAKAFMAASPKERLSLVGGLIEEKDKAQAEAFLLALISEAARNIQHRPGRAKAVKEMIELAGYLKDRAPSLKLILERTALLDFRS